MKTLKFDEMFLKQLVNGRKDRTIRAATDIEVGEVVSIMVGGKVIGKAWVCSIVKISIEFPDYHGGMDYPLVVRLEGAIMKRKAGLIKDCGFNRVSDWVSYMRQYARKKCGHNFSLSTFNGVLICFKLEEFL